MIKLWYLWISSFMVHFQNAHQISKGSGLKQWTLCLPLGETLSTFITHLNICTDNLCPFISHKHARHREFLFVSRAAPVSEESEHQLPGIIVNKLYPETLPNKVWHIQSQRSLQYKGWISIIIHRVQFEKKTFKFSYDTMSYCVKIDNNLAPLE